MAHTIDAVVVLDVTGTAGGHQRLDVRVRLALKFGEDLRVRQAQHVGLHVESATVGHPERDVFDAFAGRQHDGFVEQEDERVKTLNRELLGPEEGALEERLKALDAQEAD